MIEGESLGKILKQGVAAFALEDSAAMKIAEEEHFNPKRGKILEEFQDVFQIPQGLPPPRYCDHHIPL